MYFSVPHDNKREFVIRMAILSFRTRLRTIDKAIEILNNTRLKLEKEYNYK